MTGRSPSGRAPFSIGATALVLVCYALAATAAALIPGLQGAGQALAVGTLLACLAGIGSWLAAPRLARPAPPLLPDPPLHAQQGWPETQRLAQRLQFDRQLDRALELAEDEAAVGAIITKALQTIPPHAPAEFLLLGGQRRNLIQVVEVGPDGEGPGCPVLRHQDCEAIRRNRTLRFASGDDVDACRHLADRHALGCSAVCTPVRVLGEAIGVLHRTGADGLVASDLEVSYLESLAAKVESRLGLLRLGTVNRTRDSGNSDGLDHRTGICSQPALEQKILGLARGLTPFALAQCDIDHFTSYAARHGEGTAEDALRTLGQAALRCLRPHDLLGHGGGDEFLAVFPETSAGDAARALERLRVELLLEQTYHNQPPFTVSFGIIESSFGRSLDELLVQADAAAALAKQLGRNRVALAGDTNACDE